MIRHNNISLHHRPIEPKEAVVLAVVAVNSTTAGADEGTAHDVTVEYDDECFDATEDDDLVVDCSTAPTVGPTNGVICWYEINLSSSSDAGEADYVERCEADDVQLITVLLVDSVDIVITQMSLETTEIVDTVSLVVVQSESAVIDTVGIAVEDTSQTGIPAEEVNVVSENGVAESVPKAEPHSTTMPLVTPGEESNTAPAAWGSPLVFF